MIDIGQNEENKFTIEEKSNPNLVYGTEITNPPLIVVVQGGKKSGKSTLIRSLVKYYTNQNVNAVNGSITIRNSKNQRMTFIECPNDISAMIDLSKIADIALCMIDCGVGFEMETFEFLSLLKNHGFTSVMGVLTHMDKFRVNKSLNKLKKQIKKRFIKEATDKAKLFYLFGIKNGLYVKMQMHNLARYLKVIKPNEIGFRQNHPYIYADRFDITFVNSSSNDPEDDVMVSFFGYVRGNNFNKNSTVHINGLGDYSVDYVNKNDDPCPIETVEIKGKKKRTLKQKEKTLYAPYCNVNSLEYDRNAGYITIPDKFVTFTRGIKEDSNVQLDEGVRMVRELQSIKNGVIDKQIQKDDSFEIFEGVDYKDNLEDENENEDVTDEGEMSSENQLDEESDKKFSGKRNVRSKDNSNMRKQHKVSLSEKNISNLQHIKNLGDEFEFKSDPLYYNENPTDDITKIIYEQPSTDDDDEFNNFEDNYKYNVDPEFDLNFYINKAKKRFITGSSIFENEGNEELSADESEEEDEHDGSKKNKKNKKDENKVSEEQEPEKSPEEFAKEQELMQQKINHEMKQFLKEEFGLFEKGSYVRIDIKKVKRKHVEHFKIEYPIVLCTINIQESSLGFMKIRFDKHIWHPKILKTNDPIILSIGWKKFQTTPIYCVEDKNYRLRMIKYTPKYRNCFAIAYGPLLPINSAVVAIQNYSNESTVGHFRICGTGDLIEVNQNFEITKKLKLIGEPMEIFKKTAFIKGMFNSNLEVARYIGAKIRTVSGIRGQIKKALNIQPEGAFRATFEDKILKSDIVFLKSWTPVIPNKFYNPILNYGNMRLLRTMAQLRKDYDIPLQLNNDSEYKEIKREEKVFPSLMISKSLESSLPFKSKNKVKSVVKGKSINYEEDDTFLLKKLNLPHNKPIKNYMTEKEKSIYSMLQRLQTIKNIKDKKTKQVAKEYEDKLKNTQEKEEKLKKKKNREKMISNIKKRHKEKMQ